MLAGVGNSRARDSQIRDAHRNIAHSLTRAPTIHPGFRVRRNRVVTLPGLRDGADPTSVTHPTAGRRSETRQVVVVFDDQPLRIHGHPDNPCSRRHPPPGGWRTWITDIGFHGPGSYRTLSAHRGGKTRKIPAAAGVPRQRNSRFCLPVSNLCKVLRTPSQAVWRTGARIGICRNCRHALASDG